MNLSPFGLKCRYFHRSCPDRLEWFACSRLNSDCCQLACWCHLCSPCLCSTNLHQEPVSFPFGSRWGILAMWFGGLVVPALRDSARFVVAAVANFASWLDPLLPESSDRTAVRYPPSSKRSLG